MSQLAQSLASIEGLIGWAAYFGADASGLESLMRPLTADEDSELSESLIVSHLLDKHILTRKGGMDKKREDALRKSELRISSGFPAMPRAVHVEDHFPSFADVKAIGTLSDIAFLQDVGAPLPLDIMESGFYMISPAADELVSSDSEREMLSVLWERADIVLDTPSFFARKGEQRIYTGDVSNNKAYNILQQSMICSLDLFWHRLNTNLKYTVWMAMRSLTPVQAQDLANALLCGREKITLGNKKCPYRSVSRVSYAGDYLLYPENNTKVRAETDKLLMLNDVFSIWERAMGLAKKDIESSKAIQKLSKSSLPDALKAVKLVDAVKDMIGVDAMIEAYLSGVCVEDIVA